jgi:hypothetical protein
MVVEMPRRAAVVRVGHRQSQSRSSRRWIRLNHDRLRRLIAGDHAPSAERRKASRGRQHTGQARLCDKDINFTQPGGRAEPRRAERREKCVGKLSTASPQDSAALVHFGARSEALRHCGGSGLVRPHGNRIHTRDSNSHAPDVLRHAGCRNRRPGRGERTFHNRQWLSNYLPLFFWFCTTICKSAHSTRLSEKR